MVNLDKTGFILLFSFVNFFSFCQTSSYIIYFTDKQGTSCSINNPSAYLSSKSISRRVNQQVSIDSTDLPVSDVYVNQIKSLGAQVVYTLKWINAAYVKADTTQYKQIMALPFVASQFSTFRLTAASNVHAIHSITSSSESEPYEDFLGITQMHNKGIKGTGVLIAITDSGFPGSDTLSAFSHLWSNNQIEHYWDVADNESNVFNDDSHGTYILSILAATQSNYTGVVPDASYILLRTEVAATESKLEEYHWLRGAEIADSCGADIISCSLGYTTFDNPAANYSYADMNGETSIIAVAASKAFDKGILVVCSAGNNGSSSWKYIGTPADARNVLAIGSVDYDNTRSYFSSFGPTSDGRIKPDLCAPGSGIYCIQPNGIIFLAGGTSMATPMIAGMAAGIKQSYPNVSCVQLKNLMIQSGDQYANPDNNKGYGVPHYELLNSLAGLYSNPTSVILAPNPYSSGDLFLKLYELSNTFLIQLTDIQGKQIFSGTVSTNDGLIMLPDEIKSVHEGIYFFSIYLNGSVQVIKWIKI